MKDNWIVFDLDETLADTKQLVLAAYGAAGVPNAEKYWGRSADEWLPLVAGADASRVHELKDKLYAILLNDCETTDIELAPAKLARKLKADGYAIGVLTSASLLSTFMVLQKLDLWDEVRCRYAVPPIDKAEVLGDFGSSGVYIDNDSNTIASLHDGWRGVHYTGQSYDELLDELWMQ